LFDALSSSFVWGTTFTLSGRELVTVQSQIVFNIAGELNVDLNDLEELRLETPATENATAYDFYMKGKSQYFKYNRESNDSAVNMFRLAIQADSTFARAWAGLGDAYSHKYGFGYDPAWNDSGIVASQRAIRLDSNLSEAYKSLSSAYAGKRLYDKQLPFLKKSIELNPRNESAVGNLGTYYFVQGNLPEALRYLKESARINSTKFIPFYIIGWTYGRLGEYKRAEQWLKESLLLDSTWAQTYELLAYTYVAQKKKNEAQELIQKLTSLKSQTYKSLEKAALIAHYCGQLDRARELYQLSIEKNTNFNVDPNAVSGIGLGQLMMAESNPVKAELLLTNALEVNMKEVNRGSQDDDPPFHLAAVYAIQGKKKESLEWLQKAIARHWLDYDQIAFNPWFDNLRNDPLYRKTMKDLRSRLDRMRKEASRL
jgi:tetratricopeptide (TPR) repeat protein